MLHDVNDSGNSERVAAQYIGCSEPKLRQMRQGGVGPRHYRVGRLVRYRRKDLDDFIEQNSRGGQKTSGNLRQTQ